jgi:hypothetical protein
VVFPTTLKQTSPSKSNILFQNLQLSLLNLWIKIWNFLFIFIKIILYYILCPNTYNKLQPIHQQNKSSIGTSIYITKKENHTNKKNIFCSSLPLNTHKKTRKEKRNWISTVRSGNIINSKNRKNTLFLQPWNIYIYTKKKRKEKRKEKRK